MYEPPPETAKLSADQSSAGASHTPAGATESCIIYAAGMKSPLRARD